MPSLGKYGMGTAPKILPAASGSLFYSGHLMVIFSTCCALVVAAPLVGWIARAIRG